MHAEAFRVVLVLVSVTGAFCAIAGFPPQRVMPIMTTYLNPWATSACAYASGGIECCLFGCEGGHETLKHHAREYPTLWPSAGRVARAAAMKRIGVEGSSCVRECSSCSVSFLRITP